jgi:AraC family transcriptional regulator
MQAYSFRNETWCIALPRHMPGKHTEVYVSNLEVRIVKLEPMRIASALGFGQQPEAEAWALLWTWIEAHGLYEQIGAHRFFGFNNPSPSPASPNYGYEQWLTVDRDATPNGNVKIKDFAGGLYAVARLKGIPNPEFWQKLVRWREESKYKAAYHQWLEECLTPTIQLTGPEDTMEFDLYLPIAE